MARSQSCAAAYISAMRPARMRLRKPMFARVASSVIGLGLVQSFGAADQRAAARIPPANKCLPSGENSSVVTSPSSTSPGSSCISSRRVSTFQRRTVWSSCPTPKCGHLAKTLWLDSSRMSLKRCHKLAGSDIPQQYLSPAFPTGHGQGLAVRRKGDVLDEASSAPRVLIGIHERLCRFPGCRRPEDRRAVGLPLASNLPSLEKSRDRQYPLCPPRDGSIVASRSPRRRAEF